MVLVEHKFISSTGLPQLKFVGEVTRGFTYESPTSPSCPDLYSCSHIHKHLLYWFPTISVTISTDIVIRNV